MATQESFLKPQVSCIRNAEWIIGWDAAAQSHIYLRDGDVAWAEGRLLQVGGRYDGQVDQELPGRRRLVMPGLVNVHCHPTQTPIFRGFVEEFGNPRLFYSSRHRFRQSFLHDQEARLVAARYGLAELLACGTTSIIDLSHAYPGWLPLLAESGIRAWVAPMFRSARWWTDVGHEIKYDWYPDLGREAFAEACELMDAAESHPCGRLSALVSPAQVDTCTPELLTAASEYARARGRAIHIHGAQSYPEFNSMVRRHDMTPIEWLHSLDFLGPRTLIGHAVFTDEHPWLHWPRRNDLRLLAETGTSIAHCPTVFARDASMLHHLGAYMDAGINITLGTDTHPQNLFEEMRVAELLARCAAGPQHTSSTTRIFHAATVGAAKILGREDIGRLDAGARADLVVCDLDEPNMLPMRDPLRNLIHSSGGRCVRDVWVDGRQVVADKRVLTIDWAEAATALQAAQDRTAAGVDDLEGCSPRSLPLRT